MRRGALGLGHAQAVARRREAALGGARHRHALLERRLGGVAAAHQGAGALERLLCLDLRGLGLDDGAPRLRDRRLGAGARRGVLGELRLEDVARQPGQHLPLLHDVPSSTSTSAMR